MNAATPFLISPLSRGLSRPQKIYAVFSSNANSLTPYDVLIKYKATIETHRHQRPSYIKNLYLRASDFVRASHKKPSLHTIPSASPIGMKGTKTANAPSPRRHRDSSGQLDDEDIPFIFMGGGPDCPSLSGEIDKIRRMQLGLAS